VRFFALFAVAVLLLAFLFGVGWVAFGIAHPEIVAHPSR
jgi:hypothetical protein